MNIFNFIELPYLTCAGLWANWLAFGRCMDGLRCYGHIKTHFLCAFNDDKEVADAGADFDERHI